ncbi:hypothetical protein BJ912DRAFT_1144895 [Pholiota molesta]|nr:hypothetical protein BJ912DRAFT_1144895 [Pholiota molesta]
MPAKGETNENHNPELRRPRPRRLFSFDSNKSSSSSRQSGAGYDAQAAPPLNPFELSNVEETVEEGQDIIYAPKISRRSTDPTPDSATTQFSGQTTPGSSKLEPVRPNANAAVPLRTFASESAPSTPLSRARWDSLRRHVISASPRPPTPPQRPPSAQSSIRDGFPSRSTTPKPSRLARLGFRHVVEQARDVGNDTRKLGEELLRACSLARYPEQLKSSKEGSTMTLTATGTMASSSMAAGKKTDYLRRPQSVSTSSLASAIPPAPNGPSLRFLYQILVYHSGESIHLDTLHLPHESQVLATLLCPFLTPTKYPHTRVEEERTTATETFELVANSWTPADEAATVERCLWCTRAAGSILPSSIRTRILGLLWRLLVPGDRRQILLSTQGYQSIASGLLLLLAALYRSSTTSSTIGNNVYSQTPMFKSSKGFTFASANFQNPPHPDINLVQDLVPHFLSGSLGEVEDDRVEEVYGAELGTVDRRNIGSIPRALFSESLIMTIENAPGTGEWLLCNVIEQYWPLPKFETWSTLQAAICCRKLSSFCRLAHPLLGAFIAQYSSAASPIVIQHSRLPSSSSTTSSTEALGNSSGNFSIVAEIVFILQTRVIPEAEALDRNTELAENLVLETRKHVARILLELICLNADIGGPKFRSSPRMDVFGATSPSTTQNFESGDELQQAVKWAIDTLCQWYSSGDNSPWKFVLEKAVSQVISTDWTMSIRILSSLLKHLPENIKKPIFSFISPILNDQLVERPPPYPSPRISEFLTSLSRALPLVFFKPLFACAASDKEVVVANHLCTLQVHSKYVKDYWLRDVDMMCFALLGSAKDSRPDATQGQWGVARLGQLVLLVELTGQIHLLRHQREASQVPVDASAAESIRFVTALEARLWSMIEFQERSKSLPPSQRMLFCIIFREFRLLGRSLKPAPWVSRTLKWFDDYISDEDIGDFEKDVTSSVERVQGLYLSAHEGVQLNHKRRMSIVAANVPKQTPSDASDNGQELDLAATYIQHRKFIDSLSKGYLSKALKLFVAISNLISEEDCRTLGPQLWQHCLFDNVDSSSTAAACFMLMQCAEKTPMDVLAMIEVDMQTSDDMTRLEAIRKIGVLINWRFQIMNQNFVADRTHRPFKLSRPALPFIATDIGSGLYISSEETNETKDKDDVPLELRKRLADLGWAEEDAAIVDPRQEWIKTPFSILPVAQWDRQEVGTSDLTAGAPPSPNGSPQHSPRKFRAQRENLQQIPQPDEFSTLLRRNSSSGGPTNGVKRRAVFVPPLTLIFPRLCNLVFDSNFAVASAARTTLLDLMRNDPALLTRPFFDLLVGEHKDIKRAISTFAALMHVRRMLPPPLVHNIFNNLAGFLKFLAKHEETPDALEDFGLVLPIMSSLATQVSGMSMREIRRAKIEHLVIPTGSLWFSSIAPKGPMFPRNLGSSDNPFEPVSSRSMSSRLMSISMIRVAQNMFFLSMLKRNLQDVQIIRKNMTSLVLPSLDDEEPKALDLRDFLPQKFLPEARSSRKNGHVEVLSLMVARSSILLIAQIFRSMPRHLSDRHELAVLIDGLNRALLAHGDDINIVSQVLIALMVASTRFRRLFTSGSGYNLFMPALVKVYAETPSHPGIRNAIEYAVNRFYALHQESFLYQAINTIGQLSMLPDIDTPWFSKGVYELFSSLKRGVSPSAADVGGIYNANKAEEREALILHTADEKPQTFLSAIRRVDSQNGRQMFFQLPDEYESSRLSMDDFVRLFLTVIAHDLSISRAQHFLRLLLFLTPHLYHASSLTRAVLSDGISALGQIFTKVFAKPKHNEKTPKPTGPDEGVSFLPLDPGLAKTGNERTKSPSDSKSLRLDYLRLVVAFGSAGGQVSLAMARHAFEVVRSLLKDWGDTSFDPLTSFFDDFVKMLLNREEQGTPKAIVAFLQELSPLLHSHMSAIDFTGVFHTILKLSEMPIYANDSRFCQVVVEEICTAGLAACDLAISNNQLMTLPCRPTLVSLLAEAVLLKGSDIIAELENRPPTYQFLSGVVLPLTLSMKTEAHVIGNGLLTKEHRRVLAVAWVRILVYAMTACQKSRRDEDGTRHLRGLAGSFTRSKPNAKGRQEGAFWRSHLPTFMTAMQIIKVVVVRGEADISFLPQLGIWERLAAFFKTMLAEGNADFALKPEISSTASTPTGSPRNSAQFDLSNSASRLFVSTSSDLSRPGSPFSHTERIPTYYRPRIIDYSLWSILEFACAYRSPLRMQLKVLTMEKVVTLDHELQHQAWSTGGLSPSLNARSSRRVSTSIFSKPRKRGSGLLAPSPESSPRMMPSPSILLPSPSLLEIPRLEIPMPRRPGYQVSPVSPYDRPGLPKIVHLGPVSPIALTPVSPSLGGIKPSKSTSSGGTADGDADAVVARATKIKSLKLIQETYRRIRGVQSYMGYELLLPIPGSSMNAFSAKEKDEDAGLETWSKSQALNAIVNESKDLLEEFEESFGLDEDSVMIEMDQTMTSYSSN